MIFLINLPIGIFGTVWAYMTLREQKNPATNESFDFPAAGLFTAGLFSLLFGVTWGLLYAWNDFIT